jgi:hypothetical protein
MSDTYDSYLADHTGVPPLTRAICNAYPTTMFGGIIGPVVSDKSLRALLDALAGLEARVTTLEA